MVRVVYANLQIREITAKTRLSSGITESVTITKVAGCFLRIWENVPFAALDTHPKIPNVRARA